MITIISPATTMNFDKDSNLENSSNPVFKEDVNYLISILKELNIKEISNLMNLSEDLSKLNYDRYQNLLDSNNKKIKFLEELIKILGITNVSLIYGRCETFAKDNKEKFDIVTSRAVARLRILCELALPLLKINGKFIAMKGNITDEIIEANDTISILNSKIIEQDIFKLPIENSNRENVVIKKNNSCDDKYPRDYDKIINLASEAKQKLKLVKPISIGQAARISGVNPSDIAILAVYLKKEYGKNE